MPPHRSLRVIPIAIAIAIAVVAHAEPVFAQQYVGSWTPHGVAVETATSEALAALPVADGSGGLFVAWRATSGIPAGEVRVMHLLADGSPDPAWPAAGTVVGTYPGKLEAVSDRAGGIYVAFGAPNSVRCVRLLASGLPAAGWPVTGLNIGGTGFTSLHTTADGSVWGAFARIVANCPIGHSFCENIILVGARRLSAAGVDLTGPFPGGFFHSHAADLIYFVQAATHDNGMWIYYEISWIGAGYARYLVGNPVGGIAPWIPIGSGNRDYSLHLAANGAGAAFTTEGSYETSIVRRNGPGTAWPAPWTYPLGAYGGAYPLDILANPDGSLLSHSMAFETSPSPHIVDSFVQRILPNGATDPAWPLQGVSTRGSRLFYQNARSLVPDGRGGCLAVWEDTRAGEPDIYGLAIEPNGQTASGWVLSGTAICQRSDSPQTAPRATHDALGDLFVTWIDRRNGGADVYAQKIAPDRPVPVAVQHASGRWTGSLVELHWKLTDSGAGPWQVQRSRDQVEWIALADAVPGTERDAWIYLDREPWRAIPNHYRLVGVAGTVRGAEVTVDIPGQAAFGIVSVAPNPAASSADVRLSLPSVGTIVLEVLDVTGRTRVRRARAAEIGSLTFRLDELQDLPAGLYWLRATHAGLVSTARLLVSR